MNNLAQNIQQATEAIERTRQHVLAQQAALFMDDPGKRPSIRNMQQTVWINSQQPIAWPNWPPGLVAKFKAVLQKVVRRALQWYIDPIVQQQNLFNQATLQALTALAKEVATLQTQQSAQNSE